MDHGSNNQKLFNGMINDLKDVVNQAQRNSTIDIKIKTNIDDAIKKFGELNNNIAEFGKISKYFQSKDNALARFIEEWNNLVSHNNGKKISDVVDIGNNESVDVYRLATAFEALGGDISSLPKEIQEFINSMKQISKNPAFGLENMKEAFDGIADLMNKGWIEEFPSYVRGKLQIPIIQSFENVSKESKSYSDTTQQTSQQTQKSYDDMANTAEKSAERQKKALASIEDMRSKAASRKQDNTIDSDYSFRGKLGWRSDKSYIEQVDLSGDTDLEKYTNAVKELQKQQGNALTEAQRIYNDYINQINAGESVTLDESALNHQLDIYNDYCDGMEYAQNKLREARKKYTEELSNFTSSGKWDEDTINGLIKALKNLAIEIHEIAKAFGTIDDESEMPTLLSQLKDISGKIPEAFDVKNLDAFKQSLNVIEGKILEAFNADKLQGFIDSLNDIKQAIDNIEPSQFSPTIGTAAQSTDPREWAKEYEHYISLYNKITKQVEQVSQGQYTQNDIFGAIINSSRNLGQQFNFDEDQIRDLYGLKTIQDSVDGTIEGYKAAIQRVMDYVKLLKTAMQESQGAIDLFKGIPKVLTNNNNTLNMSTLEKQVGKRVKADTDKAAEEANEQVKGLFSTDLTGVQQSLNSIITALNTLQSILKQGFGIKDEEGTIGFFDKLSQKFQEISKATEALKESFATLVGLIGADKTDLIGIKPETIQSVTQAFTTLRDVIKEIYELQSKLGVSVREVANQEKQAIDNSKTVNDKPKKRVSRSRTEKKIETPVEKVTSETVSTTASDAVDNAMNPILQAMKSKMGSIIESVKTTGEQVPAGMSSGINEGKDEVADAAKNLAEEAVKKAKENLEIESPSRVFMAIGKYCVEGFVIGIQDNQDDVARILEDTFSIDKYLKGMMSSGSQEEVFNKLFENITGKFNISNKEAFAENLKTYLNQILNGVNTDETLGEIGSKLPTQQVLKDTSKIIESMQSFEDMADMEVLQIEIDKINSLFSALERLGQMFEKAGENEEVFINKLKKLPKSELVSLINDSNFYDNELKNDTKLTKDDLSKMISSGYKTNILGISQPTKEMTESLDETGEQAKITDKEVKSLASTIKDEFGLSVGSVNKLKKAIVELFNAIKDGKSVDADFLKNILYQDKNYIEKVKQDDLGTNVRQYLTNKKIKNLPDYKAEFGDDWDARKRSLGFNIISNKGGQDIFEIIDELNTAFGNIINVDEITNDADAMRVLTDITSSEAIENAKDYVDQLFRLGDLDLSNIISQIETLANKLYPKAEVKWNMDDDYDDLPIPDYNPQPQSQQSRTQEHEETAKAITEETNATTALVDVRTQLNAAGKTNEQVADDIMRNVSAREQERSAIEGQTKAELALIEAQKEESSTTGRTIIAHNGVEVIDTPKNSSSIISEEPYVDDEISSFERLRQFINVDLIDAIKNKDDEFYREVQVVTEVVDAELQQLERLRLFLYNDIPLAISEKNTAFQDELSVVQQIVEAEITQFDNLKNEMTQKIKEGIDSINIDEIKAKFDQLFTSLDYDIIPQKIVESLNSINSADFQTKFQDIFNAIQVEIKKENIIVPDIAPLIQNALGQIKAGVASASADGSVQNTSESVQEYKDELNRYLDATGEFKGMIQKLQEDGVVQSQEVIDSFVDTINQYIQVLENFKQKYRDVMANIDLERLNSAIGYTQSMRDSFVSGQYTQKAQPKTQTENPSQAETQQPTQITEEYQKLQESIQKVIEEIDILKTSISTVNNETGISTEVESLRQLSNTLGEITTAIENKNQAFQKEATIVSESVEKEIGSLKNLKDSIDEIKGAVIFLNSNIATMGEENKGGLFSSIQDILNKGEELKNFAQILSSTEDEIKRAKEAVSTNSAASGLDTISKEANEANQDVEDLGNKIEKVVEKSNNTRNNSIFDTKQIKYYKDLLGDIIGNLGEILKITTSTTPKGDLSKITLFGSEGVQSFKYREEDPDQGIQEGWEAGNILSTEMSKSYSLQFDQKSKEIDDLEKQIKDAGALSDELSEKLSKLRRSLDLTGMTGEFKTYNIELNGFKKEADEAIKKANQLSEAIQKEYNDDISTINKLKDARSAYNKTLAANIKDPIKTNAEDVEKANQALIRANKEASKSLEDVVQKYREGKISAEQYFEAFRAMGSEENRLGSEESRREVRNAQNEANTKEYNSYLKTIDAVIDAKSKLNKLEAEEITKGGEAVTNRKIEAQREYEQALERVTEAYLKLVDMEESGNIGETQREAFVDRLAVGTEFWKGNSNSQDAISKAITTQYSKAETAIKKYEEELQKVEKYQNALANGESVAGRLVGATNNMETAKKTAVELLQVLERINETNTVSGLGVLKTRVSNANTSYDRTKEFDGTEADRGFENAQRGYETLAKNAVAYYKVQQKIASGSAISANDYKLLGRLGEYFELAAKGADNFKNKLGVVEDKLQETNRAEKDFGEKSAEAMSAVVNSALNDVQKKIVELGQKTGPENFKTTFQSLSEEFAALEARIGKIDWNGKSEEDFKQVIADITHVMDKARNLDTGDMYQSVNAVQKETLIRKMAEWQNQNQAAREAIEQIERLKNTLKTVDDQGRLNEVEEEFERIKTAANEAGTTGQTFAQKLKTSFSNLSRYLMSFASFYRIVGTIKQAIGVVRELDTALTEMRKVSDESLQSLKNFQLESFNMADKFGTTAKQIQESTADWLRLGENFKSAQESAGLSTMLLNVSEFQDINSATESLVAMSQAYKDIDKIDIIDKLNNIGNNFSISTNQLAESLQKSAGTLTVANNTLDEAIALTVAGNQVLQDPLTVGQSLKTISLRLQGTSMQDMQEIGEEVDGLISTQSKLRQTIMDATKVSSNSFKGFDILNNQGNYKSTYEILKGISEIYQEIGEEDKKFGTNRQSLILETIAKGLLWYVEIHMRYIFNCR